jgi:hypothetical protein
VEGRGGKERREEAMGMVGGGEGEGGGKGVLVICREDSVVHTSVLWL